MTTSSKSKAPLLHLAMLTLAVVLIAIALVLGLRAHTLRNDPALANRALLDDSVGRDAIAAVSRALTQVLSYDWEHPEDARTAADQLLSGQARQEYDTLFAGLQQRAPGQKLVLSSQVQVAALQHLTAKTATLLVFIDQSSTRAKDKEASYSAAQLRIDAKRQGTTWVITGLHPL